MTKMAICGKGGSGKSTTVALLAHGVRASGRRVLVVDSDESNPGLYRMLGFDERPASLLELVGGKKQVFPTFSEESESRDLLLAREEIQVADLPQGHIVERDGIGLVSIGKILQSFEGCACPMGVLSREFLKRLRLEENEVALIDMEAGIEHFGRGVEASLDSVLVVTEPSFDSLELAAKINALAAEAGVERVWTILNKVTSPDVGLRLRQKLQERGISVVGAISYEPEIFEAGLAGRQVRHDRLETDVERIVEQVF